MATSCYTNHRRCPVCGKGNKCRTKDNEESIQCYGAQGLKYGDEINGWRVITPMRGGMGSIVIPEFDFKDPKRNDYTPEEKATWYKRQKEREERIHAEYLAEKEATKNLDLDREERDKTIREFLKDKKLFKQHRELLLKRGLSEEDITDGMFRSVAGYSGKADEILVPVWQFGYIVGYQRRMDKVEKGDSKYKWPDPSDPTMAVVKTQLKNKELPIAVIGIETVVDGKSPLNICESVGFKPLISQKKHGGIFVGFSGGQSQPFQVEELVTGLGIKQAILWPDAGSRLNSQVMGHYESTKDVLDELGVQLLIADWGQWDVDKDTGLDCDEIAPDTHIEFKSCNEFFPSMATKTEEAPKAIAAIRSLAEKELAPEVVAIRLNELSGEYSLSFQTATEILKQLRKQLDQADNREHTNKEIDKLSKALKDKLDLFEILPLELATQIHKVADVQATRPEAFLTILLGVISSLCKAETQLNIHSSWKGLAPNFFGAIVADPSQLKSPTLKAITGPLRTLETQARADLVQEKQNYQNQLALYESTPKDNRADIFPDGKPQEPRRRVYQVGNATLEGLRNQYTAHPNCGILWKCDELAGLLKGLNAYRSGKGSDNEELLQAYDGDYTPTLRAPGLVADFDRISLGIVGTIQPRVLENLIAGDGEEDSSGKWSRFAFCLQPLSGLTRFPEDGEGIELEILLSNLYSVIDSHPGQPYDLSPDAYKLFRDRNLELERLRADDSISESMRVVYGKTRGRIGKVAILLHLINEAFEGNEPPRRTIPVETVRAAIKVADFYAQQIEALYSTLSTGEALAGHLLKVLELSESKGWVKPSDVTRAMRRRCKDAATARDWFNELVAMKRGEIKGEGRAVEFRAIASCTKVDRLSDHDKNSKTLTDSGFPEEEESKSDQSDHDSIFSTDPLTESNETNIPLGNDRFDRFDQLAPGNPLTVKDTESDRSARETTQTIALSPKQVSANERQATRDKYWDLPLNALKPPVSSKEPIRPDYPRNGVYIEPLELIRWWQWLAYAYYGPAALDAHPLPDTYGETFATCLYLAEKLKPKQCGGEKDRTSIIRIFRPHLN